MRGFRFRLCAVGLLMASVSCGQPVDRADAEIAGREELAKYCRREACDPKTFALEGAVAEDSGWSVEFRAEQPRGLRIVFLFQGNGFVKTSVLRE